MPAILPGAGGAQEALRVGVPDRPPFVMPAGDMWEGIAVDLWRLSAEELGLDYAYVEMPLADAAEALAEGRVDVMLGVDAGPALERQSDLTQPIYTATLGVVSEPVSRVLDTARAFLSWRFVRIVLWLSVLLLGVGALVWAIERRRNEEQFHADPARGLGDGFWWAGVTLTTIGYGDKAPVTVLGRAVAMLWMLIGLAVSASLTAAVVTVSGAQNEPTDDLSDRVVASVEGTSAARHLARIGADLRLYETVEGAVAALEDGTVEAAAAAAPALRHAVDASDLGRRVLTTTRDPHYVVMALPDGSPLTEPLNVVLLTLLAGEAGEGVIERYLPVDG